MSTIPHDGRLLHRRPPLPVTGIVLAVLLTLLFVGAFQGGVAMVFEPHHPLGMSTDWLDGSPVDTYFWPGVFLLGMAVVSLLTVVGLLFGWTWRWAWHMERMTGFRWPWLTAIAIGTSLFVFEVVELFVVPFHPVMHPLLLVGSIAIVGLASSPAARTHLKAD
jgi:hypothetical protein